MGRLFWKLFATLFIAQLVTTLGVGSLIWLRRVERAGEVTHYAHRLDAPGEPGARPDEFGPGRGPEGGNRPDGFPPEREPPREPFAAEPGPPDGRPPPDAPIFSMRLRSELQLLPISVGLVASLLFALFLARYLSRPIVALRRAFNDVARGRFDVKLAQQMGARQDELADLGRQFDRTAQQLEGLLAHQRRLLHDISHELRSPLARIQVAIDLARQQPDKLPALVERVEREAARMDHLIEELLTLARLEAQSWIALDENVDIVEVVEDIVGDARFEAQSKQCRVELDSAPEAHVTGHAELLHRAIENVVRNAVSYSFDGTLISVVLAAERQSVRIVVSDRGPGIPEHALGAVFEPFVRLPNQQGADGYGLGLAITQRIISGHGGSITANNRDGGGLSIVITLQRVSA